MIKHTFHRQLVLLLLEAYSPLVLQMRKSELQLDSLPAEWLEGLNLREAIVAIIKSIVSVGNIY